MSVTPSDIFVDKCNYCPFTCNCIKKCGCKYDKNLVKFEKMIDEWNEEIYGTGLKYDIVTDEGLDNSRYMIQDQHNSIYLY